MTASANLRDGLLYAALGVVIILVFLTQGTATTIQLLVSAVTYALVALGLNVHWGYGGQFNFAVMGFIMLGGYAVVLTSYPLNMEFWHSDGPMLLGRAVLAAAIGALVIIAASMPTGSASGARSRRSWWSSPGSSPISATGRRSTRHHLHRSQGRIRRRAWPAGRALLARWRRNRRRRRLADRQCLPRAAVGLSRHRHHRHRRDHPRLPQEHGLVDARDADRVAPALAGSHRARDRHQRQVPRSDHLALAVSWSSLAVTAILFILLQRAYGGAWGRMMRAIRDNYVAAKSMGKNVKARQVELFVLGAVLIGIGGALMTTYVQIYDPGGYQPINYTFIVWVMVIVGGAGNNIGALFGGVLIIIAWNMSAPLSLIAFRWFDAGLQALGLSRHSRCRIARPANARVHSWPGDRSVAALRAEGPDPGTHPPPRSLVGAGHEHKKRARDRSRALHVF